VSQETSLATALAPTTLTDGVFRDGKGHWPHRFCTPKTEIFGDPNEKNLLQLQQHYLLRAQHSPTIL